MQQQPTVGQCPFLKQACIKERCHLYYEMPVIIVSQLAPTTKTQVMRACIFILLLEASKILSIMLARPVRGG